MRPRLEALARDGSSFFVARVVSRALQMLAETAPERRAHAH
jgi:hypothetical protein